MNHPFTKKTLFMLLQMGKFDIGLAVPSSYHMITNITPYFHKNNDAIRFICSGGCSGMMEVQNNNSIQGVGFDLFKLADNNTIRMPVGE